MGTVSNDRFRSRFTICRWLPKPMVFSLISFLNPVTIATEIIITAKLSATAMVAMVINGFDRFPLPTLPLTKRCAIKCSSFKMSYFSFSWGFKFQFNHKTIPFILLSSKISRNFTPVLCFPLK